MTSQLLISKSRAEDRSSERRFMITPNRLTALRIFIALASPLLLIGSRSLLTDLIVALAFTIACITDWWDGYLARKRSMITWSGKIIDPIADKLLIGGLMLAFSFLGLYAFAWVLPILIRELIVTIARLISLRRGKIIPAEWAGKVKVGFQIGSVYATLVFLIVLDSRPFLKPEPIVFLAFQSLHYLWIFLANLVTIISGIIFFRRLSET